MTKADLSLENKTIFLTGHRGMVGSGLERRLNQESCHLLTTTRQELDLKRQAEVEAYLAQHRPDIVIIAAAKVGGILANDSYPAEFLYDNLMIEANLIHGAFKAGVRRLLFLGSSCIYPKLAPQPMQEDALLTGPLEPTNEWYAIAKIAGIKHCDAYRRQYGLSYISAMPTNLYGPFDNFDLKSSHVLPALMRKIHEAKLANRQEVEIWGSGTPKREFMHVDDLANALIFLLKNYDEAGHINVGTAQEVTIRQLADLIAEVVGYQGNFVYDSSKPDGTPRKLMDSNRLLNLGWSPKISLKEGIAHSYDWFLKHIALAKTS
ncbi:MAG: GDP-L-fucose synthase [Deinococcales bacterium]